ncbi:MAG: cysteine desulfurase [Nanoarchaeota archaeon]|nr:cysteine desulfurase [Nanoarchaeota archaeon]
MFRNEFPILSSKVHGHNLVYFDNAATTQTPKTVVDSITNFYYHTNSNVHRGAHFLSQRATNEFEKARKVIANHFQAEFNQCIFTRGTTHGINLLVKGIEEYIEVHDEIVVACYEHHSNFIAFQELAKRKGAILRIIPLTQHNEFDYKAFEELISYKTRVVSLPLISNVLGEKLDVKKINQITQFYGVEFVFFDAAQIVGHNEINFNELKCSAITFSAHKCYGPTGIGAIIATHKLIKKLKPQELGGGMIEKVEFEHTSYKEDFSKLEAGTPDICGAIAFSRAIEFIEGVGIKQIKKHEEDLIDYFLQKATLVEGLNIYGTLNSYKRAGVFSMTYKDYSCYDIATLLDMKGIAIREGAHCAQPLLDILEVPSTFRVSFALYNTKEEIDYFFESLKEVSSLLYK